MLKKILFPALLTSGIVFYSCNFLIAQLESNSLEIRLGEQEIFVDKLRNMFSSQMIAFLSLGAGVTTAAVIGWSDSARKSSEVESQLSSIQKNITVTDSLIEELIYSQIEQVNSETITLPLTENELPVIQDKTVNLAPNLAPETEIYKNPQPMVMSTPSKIAEPWVVVDGVVAPETEILSQTRQKAISLFPCTQSVLGLTQVGGSQDIERENTTSNHNKSLDIPIAAPELQEKLQKIYEQIKLLDTVVESKAQQTSLNIPESHQNGELQPPWKKPTLVPQSFVVKPSRPRN
ncbi:MAG: hypothetical protein VKL59_17935 [Nostocaceae cyanobacterium]|nr:hypothetical protein [Nostocaceae cyanobacterium]